MKTLDSLPRADLLKWLKYFYDLERVIAGNREAAQEAQSSIDAASADYKRKLNSVGKGRIILGVIILLYALYYVFAISSKLMENKESLNELAELFSVSSDSMAIGLVVVLTASIALPIFLFVSTKSAKKKFLKSGAVEQINSFVAEQRDLITIYNDKINEAATKLNGSYSLYHVRPDLRSLAALRFCYTEIYHSSKIGIEEAFQRFLAKVHRDTQNALIQQQNALLQQQNEEIQRARQQAHADALAIQRLESERARNERNAQENANATLERIENDLWFNRRG